MNLQDEMQKTATAIEVEMVQDGTVKGCFLTPEECRVVAKVLYAANTICRYLELDGHRCHNHYAEYMNSHFNELKKFSEALRR